ncbi:rhomboid family intramembrane serine protease [Flammeovirga pacifica]|uniref:Peptidase S54 rhomboid domain-containing protein n=1 Tax=Flammeovirga pacifica TaxID=915059 RepID=A0A1S1YZZ2_FLAPC|nr:rhomboid family intramembrane serine protease [Flammeovirga pacifica]OHX66584.1 hypothetical protein NH26_09545 [Flammeovirga pacifica]
MNFQLTPYVKGILIINLIVFGLANLIPVIETADGLPLNRVVAFLGYHYPKSDYFEIFQPITYMFTHTGFRHIFSNMFALVIFGPMLENVMGPKRFLTLYMICGIGGGALYGLTNFYEMHNMEVDAAAFITNSSPENLTTFFEHHANYYLRNTEIGEFVLEDYPEHYQSHPEIQEQAITYVRQLTMMNFNTPMIGASGAIFGILFTFAYLFPNLRLMLLFPPIPMKAKYLVGGYILFEVYELMQNNPGDNVAHLAHLGGALFAFILMKRWKYISYQ